MTKVIKVNKAIQVKVERPSHTMEEVSDRLFPVYGDINAIHVMEYAKHWVIRFEDEDGNFHRIDWDLINDTMEEVYFDKSRQPLGV